MDRQTDVRRLIVACHNVANMPKNNKEIKLMECDLCHSRSRGRPKQRWEDNIIQDIHQLNIKNWTVCVQDRTKWKHIVEKAKNFNKRS